MAKLTDIEAMWFRPVVHDIFVAGGLVKNSVRTAFANSVERRGLTEDATLICNEIKNRSFDFPNVERAIRNIADNVYFTNLHNRDSASKKLTVNQIANILAYACATQEVYWDDVNTSRTTVEISTYRVGAFGKACWNFKCFLSQQSASKTSSMPRVTSTTRGARGTSSYKASGPQSGKIGGLIGEPGEKTYFSGARCYDIECTCPTKRKPQFVFIDPISNKADPNKVRFGDPSGQTACKLIYRTLEDAKKAIDTIYEGGLRIPGDITGLTAAKMLVDGNGYFKVRTEIGEAYIKARILNEQVEEELEEASNSKSSKKFPEILDVDTYSEAMHRFE